MFTNTRNLIKQLWFDLLRLRRQQKIKPKKNIWKENRRRKDNKLNFMAESFRLCEPKNNTSNIPSRDTSGAVIGWRKWSERVNEKLTVHCCKYYIYACWPSRVDEKGIGQRANQETKDAMSWCEVDMNNTSNTLSIKKSRISNLTWRKKALNAVSQSCRAARVRAFQAAAKKILFFFHFFSVRRNV